MLDKNKYKHVYSFDFVYNVCECRSINKKYTKISISCNAAQERKTISIKATLKKNTTWKCWADPIILCAYRLPELTNKTLKLPFWITIEIYPIDKSLRWKVASYCATSRAGREAEMRTWRTRLWHLLAATAVHVHHSHTRTRAKVTLLPCGAAEAATSAAKCAYVYSAAAATVSKPDGRGGKRTRLCTMHRAAVLPFIHASLSLPAATIFHSSSLRRQHMRNLLRR